MTPPAAPNGAAPGPFGPTFDAFAAPLRALFSLETLEDAWITAGRCPIGAANELRNRSSLLLPAPAAPVPTPAAAPRPLISFAVKAPVPTPTETRTVVLTYGMRNKLVLRPASLQAAIAKAASAEVFNLASDLIITLQVQVGDNWADVFPETWNSAALTKDDPTTLKVIVAFVPRAERVEKRAKEVSGAEQAGKDAAGSVVKRPKVESSTPKPVVAPPALPSWAHTATSPVVNVTVKRIGFADTHVKCKRSTPVSKIIDAVAAAFDLKPNSFLLRLQTLRDILAYTHVDQLLGGDQSECVLRMHDVPIIGGPIQ
ncbi:hypothetical protein RQP46_009551 [Phenoliferia psychrophenolica]